LPLPPAPSPLADSIPSPQTLHRPSRLRLLV
jgi:hypothetical protein